MKDSLFKKLCTSEVLKIGWHLARSDSTDDFATDPIGYADYASHLPHRLEYLCEELRTYRYRPRHLLDIDIPKSGLSVRPGNVLPIEESLILHAIVFLLAQKLDARLSENVYSFRLHKDWKKRAKRGESMFREGEEELPFLKKSTIRKFDPIEPWYTLWPEFDKQTARAVRELGCTHLTKTDISAYFENIDLRMLETQIRSLLRRDEDDIIQLLFRVLNTWTRETSTGTPVGRGIPQGNDVSSFLGNLYLIPLDRNLDVFCKKHGGMWCRYVDDVKVMTKNEAAARGAVFVINDALRKLHLNLQGSKTRIISGPELDAAIYDPDGELVNSVIDDIKKLHPLTPEKSSAATATLKRLNELLPRFRRNAGQAVKNLDGETSRILRRMMTAYGMCGRPHLIHAAFTALRHLPDLRMLQKSLRYLTQQPVKRHDEVTNRLLALLHEDALPFPYQRAVVIDHFRLLHPSKPTAVASKLRQLAQHRRQDWYVLQKTAEAIVTFPYREQSAKRLALRLIKASHPWVRRAGCVLLVRCPVGFVRTELDRLVYHADQATVRLALYFQRHLNETAFAEQRLAQIEGGSQADRSFLYAIPSLYVLRCSPERHVVVRLSKLVEGFANSRSEKVKWHVAKLRNSCQWALRSS